MLEGKNNITWPCSYLIFYEVIVWSEKVWSRKGEEIFKLINVIIVLIYFFWSSLMLSILALLLWHFFHAGVTLKGCLLFLVVLNINKLAYELEIWMLVEGERYYFEALCYLGFAKAINLSLLVDKLGIAFFMLEFAFFFAAWGVCFIGCLRTMCMSSWHRCCSCKESTTYIAAFARENDHLLQVSMCNFSCPQSCMYSSWRV